MAKTALMAALLLLLGTVMTCRANDGSPGSGSGGYSYPSPTPTPFPAPSADGLAVGCYDSSCPDAEDIVRGVVQEAGCNRTLALVRGSSECSSTVER
jgi:peroxidase